MICLQVQYLFRENTNLSLHLFTSKIYKYIENEKLQNN